VGAVNSDMSGSDMNRNEKGKGFEFGKNGYCWCSVPTEYIKPIEQGLLKAMRNGVLAGYPVEDIKLRLFDVHSIAVRFIGMAFKIAGSMAFQEGCEKSAGPSFSNLFNGVEA